MNKKLSNLLFKNAFRVFGKTKLLATELSILTLVSTSVLTAASLTNINLDHSKNEILNNSNPIEYTLFNNEDFEVSVNCQNVDESNLIQPKFTSHLNITNNLASIPTKYGTSNNLQWMQNSPNNKLNYYYVTNPTINGENLLKIGNNDQFASLNILESNKTILEHVGEIFSFIENKNQDHRAIPTTNETNNVGLDMKKILFDEKNQVAAGISEFGYSQIIGFDLNKKISIYHNVVDTKNENQYVIDGVANRLGGYAVPNEQNLILGKQDESTRKFYIKNADILGINSHWNYESYANILSDLADNINQIGGSGNIKWIPYEFTIDFNSESMKTKLLEELLFNPNYNTFLNKINNFNRFDFKIQQLNSEDLKNANQIYQSDDINKIKTLRYIKTYAWFPSYLNDVELKAAVDEALKKWKIKINEFIDTLISPNELWNNIDYDIDSIMSKLKSKLSKVNIENFNQLYTLIIECVNEAHFNLIDKNVFLKIINENQNILINFLNENSDFNNNVYYDICYSFINECSSIYIVKNPTLSYVYLNNYTVTGKLSSLGFEWQEFKNFTVNDSVSGNSFVISEYLNNQKLNTIVSNGNSNDYLFEKNNYSLIVRTLLNIEFWGDLYYNSGNINFDRNFLYSINGNIEQNFDSYVKNNFMFFDNKKLPKYELFLVSNALDTLQEMYENIQIITNETQRFEILNALKWVENYSNELLTKEIYEKEILPNLAITFDVFHISNSTLINSTIQLNVWYHIISGNAVNALPLNSTISPKTSNIAILSSNFLNNNKYNETNNLKGKAIYPDFNIFKEASKLPYVDVSDKNTNEKWIFNPFTQQFEFYRDFNSWIKRVPDQYKISLNGTEYLIVDEGLSADFMYPVTNSETLLINNKKTGVLYVTSSGYSRALLNNNGVNENIYIGFKFIKNKKMGVNWYYEKRAIKLLNEWINDNITTNSYYKPYKIENPNQPNKLIYTRMTFIDNFQKLIIGITMFVSILVLLLSLIFICTLLRSILKQNRLMFGVSIANGINRHQLAISFIPFALIPGIISGIGGYIIGNLLQPLLNSLFSNYWTLPISLIGWTWWLFILIPLGIILILFFISYIVVIWTLRKSVTDILSTPSTFRMNALVENSNWLFKHFKPKTAFKFTYMLGNISRFAILTGITTSFITLSTISVGTLNVFNESLLYTDRNKNYKFSFDLFSPTIQGGFYNPININLLGTSNAMMPSSYESVKRSTVFSNPIKYNNELTLNTIISSSCETLQTWFINNSQIDSSGIYTFNHEISSKWLNMDGEATFKAKINLSNDTNIFNLLPYSYVRNNSETMISNNGTIPIAYYHSVNVYEPQIYQDYWTNPYDINNDNSKTYFDAFFYPSFEIVPQIQQNAQFFSGKIWNKTLLDFDIDIGFLVINPWTYAEASLPKTIVELSKSKTFALLSKSIEFYAYLDQQNLKNVPHTKDSIDYQNYYDAMKWNNTPSVDKIYNPININGKPFKFDEKGNYILSNSTSYFTKIYSSKDEYQIKLNPNTATIGLPTFELKPEAVRTWTYITTNYLNPVYQKWEKMVYGTNENNNYSLGINTIAINDDEMTNNLDLFNNCYSYTYLNGIFNEINNKNVRNNKLKIVGIKDVNEDAEKNMIALYDTKELNNTSSTLNHLLKNKTEKGYYPLVINEVSKKLFKLSVGDIVNVNVNNGLFRYKRIGENSNPIINVDFEIVGITTSKSEQQFYTNQKFANEILGYYSDENQANKMYGKNYVPFNGFFSESEVPNIVLNEVSMYTPLGICPSSPMLQKLDNDKRNDTESAIFFNWNELNKILKFDIIKDAPFNLGGLKQVIAKIIDIANGNNISDTFLTITSSINGIDYKGASTLISKTIDTTISNIELIAIFALLPTLFIIITLMSTMIVTESRRLIAIMKVLGFGDWFNAFNFMFVYLVVLLFGLLLSIPFTYGILAGLSAISFAIFNIIVTPTAPWWIYLASSTVVALFYGLLFIVVKLKLKNIDLSQAISF